MKNVQIKKDIQHGQGNRTAEGQSVLGDGSKPEHHSHVSRATPFQTKLKEITSDPQYQAEAINPAREMRTTAKRRAKDTRPL